MRAKLTLYTIELKYGRHPFPGKDLRNKESRTVTYVSYGQVRTTLQSPVVCPRNLSQRAFSSR